MLPYPGLSTCGFLQTLYRKNNNHKKWIACLNERIGSLLYSVARTKADTNNIESTVALTCVLYFQ